MILYRPTDGDVHDKPIEWRPCKAFLMTQLGGMVPEPVTQLQGEVQTLLAEHGYDFVDADSLTTGKDFLLKIWQLAISVPVGIAIVHEGIPPATMANVFYELGWMQAYGKETILLRVGNADIPSDLVRTEYVNVDEHFERHFRSFLSALEKTAAYYAKIAELVEKNPLLSIDYLRRAYLLTGDTRLRERAKEIYRAAGLSDRARNSVETLLINF